MCPLSGPDAACGLCGPFAGSAQLQHPQKCPVGAKNLVGRTRPLGAPSKPSEAGSMGRGGRNGASGAFAAGGSAAERNFFRRRAFAETPRWGGCLPFRVGQASRSAIRRPHSPGRCPDPPALKGGPHRNPAKRLRWGEEEQGSAVGNARRAFPTERTLFRRGRKEFNAEKEDRNHYRPDDPGR